MPLRTRCSHGCRDGGIGLLIDELIGVVREIVQLPDQTSLTEGPAHSIPVLSIRSWRTGNMFPFASTIHHVSSDLLPVKGIHIVDHIRLKKSLEPIEWRWPYSPFATL